MSEPVSTGPDSQTSRALFGIRRLILEGEIEVGKRIAELWLVERLGMSRTPIRVALERLAHIGLLEVRSSGGFSVRAFTVSEVRDAIEIRGVLEGTAARLAAERLRDPSELDVLRKCEEGVVASQMADDAFKDYIIQNERFHQELVSLAKSPMLSRLVSQVYALPFASPSAMVTPTAVLPSAESSVRLGLMHHESIIAAIEARQGARAEHIAREHALHSWDVFKEALSSESAIARIPGQKVIQGKA